MSKIKQYIDLMTPMEAYQKGREDAGYDEYKRGIKEVVEWLNSNPVFMQNSTLGIKTPIAVIPEWQAQKKKWGIKND